MALTSRAKRQEVSAPVRCPWEQRSVWIHQLRVAQWMALQPGEQAFPPHLAAKLR